MRTKLRSKFTLLFMTFAMLLATPAVALADITLDTSATLATDANLPTSVDVGENSFTIKVWRAGGNVGSSKTGEFSIVKEYNMDANGTITPDSTKVENFDWSDLACSGSNPAVGCTSTNPATVNAKLIVAAGAEGKSGQLQISQIAASSATSGIVTDPSPASGYVQVRTSQVDQATLTVTAPTSGTYGQAYAMTTSGGSGTGAVTFAATGTACNIPTSGDDAGKLVITSGTGTCSVTATKAGDANYNPATSAPHPVTINKRAVQVTADPQSKTYGQADPTLTYQITSGSLVTGDAFTGALSRVAGESVANSPYAIQQGTLSLPVSNYDLSYVGANLTITQKQLTGSFTASNKVYDGTTDADVTPNALSGLVGTDVVTLVVTNAQFDNKNVGSRTVTADLDLSGADAGNYSLSSATGTDTADITQRPITVTADPQNKTYGDPDPALTYEVTSPLGDALVGGDTLSGALSRVAGESVANSPYAIQQANLSAGPNYDLSYVGANLTITPAALTVTANNATKYFGDPNPNFTVQYSGFVNNETESVLGGSLVFAVTPTAGVISPNAGNYNIVPSGLTSSNYTINFVNGTLQVLQWTPGGFYQPIDMSPNAPTTIVWNTVKNGSTVPVKFEIFKIANDPSTEKRSTSDVKPLKYNEVNCGAASTSLTDEIETLATGGTVLRFDTTADQFVYNWQTPKGATQVGKCYKVTMTSADGVSSLSAYFKLK
jgi:hypothetical protein